MQAAIQKSEKMTQLATATLNELISVVYPDDEPAGSGTESTTDVSTESTTD